MNDAEREQYAAELRRALTRIENAEAETRMTEKERDEARAVCSLAWQRFCAERAWAFDPAQDPVATLKAHLTPGTIFYEPFSSVAQQREALKLARNALMNPHPSHTVDAEQHEALKAVEAALAEEKL